MLSKQTLPRALGTLVLALCLATPVFALDLGQAKQDGLVGETNTGYIAAVKPSGDVDALVADINKQRKAQYEKIARENGISLEAVEARAGLKAIERTPAGQFVNTGAGWLKK